MKIASRRSGRRRAASFSQIDGGISARVDAMRVGMARDRAGIGRVVLAQVPVRQHRCDAEAEIGEHEHRKRHEIDLVVALRLEQVGDAGVLPGEKAVAAHDGLGLPVEPLVNEISAGWSARDRRDRVAAAPLSSSGDSSGIRHSAGQAKRSARNQPAARNAFGLVAATAWRRPLRPSAGSGKTTTAPSRHSAARLA